MKTSGKKLYTVKRPSHPDTAQTKAKSYFKRRGRKRVRTYLKDELRKSSENA